MDAADQVLVVGQVARDLVLRVAEMPGERESARARQRLEMLGGKGANQAVALAQLGVPVALLGVVGDDPVADDLLARARGDGVDVSPVVRRAGTSTGLIVSLLDAHGQWRYVEDLPEPVLLTEDDVLLAARPSRCTVVQLQQPSAAALAAVRQAAGLVVLEGAPADDERRAAILAAAHVLRADAKEGGLLTGADLTDPETAVRAAREVQRAHDLALVAFGYDGGDVFVWRGGSLVSTHGDAHVVDTTGAGDALTAGLTTVLVRGGEPEEAVELAVAAAAATVEHPGGRPHLTPSRLRHFLRRARVG
ncbi:PfkB family carbohydrate kinase [Actinophytocola glycyrrhizae]|uniref:PfkB family carbohydrate kinase n=1 Tax=Actinophytocola glycyrrhizae TaxID=2044873 RepID=A0ABV9S235_9PSEU